MSGQVGTSRSKSNVIGRSQDTAKAWINFNGTTVDGTADLTGVRASYNISSLVDRGTGIYTVNFSSSLFAEAKYVGVVNACAEGATASNRSAHFEPGSSSWAYLNTWQDTSGNLIDCPVVLAAFFGD